MPKRTSQPKKRKRLRTHGIRNRSKAVIKRRLAKGRTRLAVAAVSK